MGSKPVVFVRENNIKLLRCFFLIFLSCITARINLCSNVPSDDDDDDIPYYFLKTLELDGSFNFDDLHHVAKDFGNRFQLYPSAILSPKSVSDISTTINHIYRMGSSSKLTVAARGNGHSLHGQAHAHRGVVIEMEPLRRYNKIQVARTGNEAYVDVYGGELWINILQETLKYGLSPKSWTDYLYLTVGGTLSNAGISGQAFQHGPQICNVYQLEVVTGKGEVLNCSKEVNSDLFHGVLGGLGQFGIITRARIALQPAPKMVRWIRVLYPDFSMFANDQEHLIFFNNTFDYIEGFVLINRTGLLNNWRSSFSPQDPDQAARFNSDERTLYCLEMAKYFNLDNINVMNQEVESLLSQLSFIPSTLFYTEVSYLNFLDRVHSSEIKLRSEGLWEVPHPWLNLLIPRSRIHDFVEEVSGKILTHTSNGPVLIYPLDKSKWSNRTSAVTPEENIFYLVAFLSSAMPSSTGTDSLEHILNQNERILDFCQKNKIGMKQYLADYTTKEEWRTHFGSQWDTFVQRKITYDPLAILAPGQKIFRKGITVS